MERVTDTHAVPAADQPDSASWRGWLGGKVAHAEAAFAAVFTAPNTASPPASPSQSHSPQHTDSQDQLQRDASKHDPAPRMQRTASGLYFSEAWAAVRRAAVSTMAGLEQQQPQQPQQNASTDAHSSEAQKKQRVQPPEGVAKASSTNPQSPDHRVHVSGVKKLHHRVHFAQPPEQAIHHPKHKQPTERGNDATRTPTRGGRDNEPPLTEHQLFVLKKRYDQMFERNGGAYCVARVKDIADTQLMRMRDSTTMDARVFAELRQAKHILDDALSRLESAARQKTDDTGHAISAAESVIEQTKQTNYDHQDLVEDCSRLLAVFASNVCAAVLQCVEQRHHSSWTQRVEHLVNAASVGVGQLRSIGFSFAAELAPRATPARALRDVSVKHILHCVALAVAALHAEAAERAVQCTIAL